MTKPATRMAALAALSPQRALVIGGLLLILVGMIFGDIFAVFILHPNNGNIGQAMFSAAQAIPGGDTETVWQQFQQVGGFLQNRGTKVDAHNHIIQFGYLALLLALIQPYVALSQSRKQQLMKLFLIGAIVLPPSVFAIYYVGLTFSPLQDIGWASIGADLGGLLVIVACLGQLSGLWRYLKGQRSDSDNEILLDCKSWQSRALLTTGVLMLMTSFIFGAYHAATAYEPLKQREKAALTTIVEQANANNMEAVGAAFGDFGQVQAERGIKIASHAHMNEMGMLLILLAFVQPFVYYSEKWQRRWAKGLIIGSVGLPVFVMMELEFGLLAGGIADSSGLLAIISLFAMLFGIFRYTGREDAKEQAQ